MALTLTAGKIYDVFLWDNAGTLTLELSAPWTNDTTRADALSAQNGRSVKTGATSRNWVGTIRATGTNQTSLVFGGLGVAPSLAVWNAYNRVDVAFRALETTDSWTYSTLAWRQKNASAVNQVNVVCGQPGEKISLRSVALSNNGSGSVRHCGIGRDATNAIATGCLPGYTLIATADQIAATLDDVVPLGWHYYAEIEESGAVGTTTWYGDAGAPTQIQTGISGRWRC